MKRSHDNGMTWEAATTLPFAADTGMSTQHRAQTVYDRHTDSIFLFDDARGIGSTQVCAVQVWRSVDRGAPASLCFAHVSRSALGLTWQLAANLTDVSRNTGSGLATGIQLPSGKLTILLIGTASVLHCQHTIFSVYWWLI